MFPVGMKKITSDTDMYGMYFFDELGKVFRYCQNKAAGATAAGDAGAYTYANGLSYQVIVPTTATLDQLAGVWSEVVAVDASGSIQVSGPCNALVDGTVDVSIGDSLKGVDAQKYLVKDAAGGTAATYKQHVKALVAWATNSAALKAVDVRCM